MRDNTKRWFTLIPIHLRLGCHCLRLGFYRDAWMNVRAAVGNVFFGCWMLIKDIAKGE